MKTTATELRSNLYKYLDRLLETGEVLEIERKGRILRIVAEDAPPKLSRIRKKDTIIGDPETLIEIDWTDTWDQGSESAEDEGDAS